MEHEILAQNICNEALKILKMPHLKFRPMARRGLVNTKKSYIIGRTNLKTGLITIDIWTPKKQEAKKISSILSILCHEIAHHQKPPYRQKYKGHLIIRRHYPKFYRQVKKNILRLKNNKEMGEYFV
ncbi:MAG: hypothetical protein PHT51_01965 [Patescibacteria group bacterium]|nr:hypothetical protein [Patescibacteria group bacterium]MDD4610336.1 hypothetical protein [Patescibacteria group bacterium]